jgi:hypothetical protein
MDARDVGFTLRVQRLDGELLVLDGLALARAFFAGDVSSVGESSFDALAGAGNPKRIELADVIAMNRTMRARSPHRVWEAIVEAEVPWLAGIPDDLDLLELEDEQWQAAGGDKLIRAALHATIGPGRGMAVATKLLHSKRPRLFPVLDRFVAEMLGMNLPGAAGSDGRVELAVTLTETIRLEGRRNLQPLKAIRDQLAAEWTQRPLIRIFDAIVWFSHPAAGIKGTPRAIEVRLHDPESSTDADATR